MSAQSAKVDFSNFTVSLPSTVVISPITAVEEFDSVPALYGVNGEPSSCFIKPFVLSIASYLTAVALSTSVGNFNT